MDDDGLGGVALFLGRVRSPNRGQAVHYLDYEGYEEMILATMASIADELRVEHRTPSMRVAIHHRLGRLYPGEVSLAIAVAAPHRGVALTACAACLEAVKRRLPIWKLEVGAETTEYVAGNATAGEAL